MAIDLPVEDREPAIRLDNQNAAIFGQTPSQTVGPFFHYGLPWKGGADLVGMSGMGARPDLFGEEHYVLNLSSPKGRPARPALSRFREIATSSIASPSATSAIASAAPLASRFAL